MPTQIIIDGVIYYAGLVLIHGTVLALATWLLCATLLRHSRPAVQAVLWAIVLVKFLLPPILPGEMALSGWIAEAVTKTTVTRIAPRESPTRPIAVQPLPDQIPDPLTKAPRYPTAHIIFFGYLILVGLLSIRALLAVRRTRHRVSVLPLADQTTRDEILVLANSIGLKHPPDVRATCEETTPYVFGFRRVVMVLPQRLMGTLASSERRALILHELAHIRRHDHLIRGLQSVAGVLFFFFPPVRWICRRIDHYTEMACDRWAIAVSEVEPYAYAGALVRVLKEMRPAPQAQLGLPFAGRVERLEERVRAALQDDAGKSPRVSAGAKVLLGCWSLFVLAGGSAAETRKELPGSSSIARPSAGEISPGRAVKNDESKVASETASPQALLNVVARQTGNPGNTKGVGRQAAQEVPHREKNGSPPPEVEAMERHAPESRSPQGAAPQSTATELSAYEKGFQLGSRYAAERNRWSQTPGLTNAVVQPSPTSLEAQSKREIELRMQSSKHPLR
jgi:beta-lactamase regulating signal transducer with metallopeptidase domain